MFLCPPSWQAQAMAAEAPGAPVLEGEADEEEGDSLTLRDCLLDLGEAIDPFTVSVGQLASGTEEAPGVSVALVPVTVVEDSCLVAVPHACWNKAIARRRLPKRCLTRAVNVEVAAQGEPPTRAHAALKVKVWIGFLDREQEARWTAGNGEEAQFPFRVSGSPGTSALPFFPALLQVAQEQFDLDSRPACRARGARCFVPACGRYRESAQFSAARAGEAFAAKAPCRGPSARAWCSASQSGARGRHPCPAGPRCRHGRRSQKSRGLARAVLLAPRLRPTSSYAAWYAKSRRRYWNPSVGWWRRILPFAAHRYNERLAGASVPLAGTGGTRPLGMGCRRNSRLPGGRWERGSASTLPFAAGGMRPSSGGFW